MSRSVSGHTRTWRQTIDHWAQLTGVLRQQGTVAYTPDLKGLPHDVVLSERLLALVGDDPGDAVQP
jgi:hypothetical protein